MAGDLDSLVAMGFEKEKSQLALKASGGNISGAIDWLDKNADKAVEELKVDPAEDDPSIEAAPLPEGAIAQSLKCDECEKKFRSMAQAQAHGERTGHENFSESTEEIAPLTEEQKKAALEELKIKAAARKAAQSVKDKEEAKNNEKIRQKSTREVQDIKEKLAQQEQIKEAAKKRAEKQADIAAKKRIQEKIAADKEARRLKAEQQKAEREGRAAPQDPSLIAAQAAASSSAPAAPRASPTEARLRLQVAGQNVIKTFPVDTTLFEVAQAIEGENGGAVSSFTMTYPKKTFEGPIDFGKTLKENGMAPSAVLIIK